MRFYHVNYQILFGEAFRFDYTIGEAIKHIVYFLRGEEKMFAHDSDAYEHGVRGDTVPKSMYVKIDAITKMPIQ